MISPLPVLRAVVNRGALDLDLAGGQISLKILLVVERVPEAPLRIGEEAELLRLPACVGEPQLLDFTRIVHGHEDPDIRGDALLLR